MPKITHFHRSRNISLEMAPRKLRMKMLRHQLFFVVQPTGTEGDLVRDLFDDLDTGMHEHSKGLFHLHTNLENEDGEYQDATRYLQVRMYFEHFADLESVQKNYLLPLKLSF